MRPEKIRNAYMRSVQTKEKKGVKDDKREKII